MTVAELIEKLKALPPDSPVLVCDDDRISPLSEDISLERIDSEYDSETSGVPLGEEALVFGQG